MNRITRLAIWLLAAASVATPLLGQSTFSSVPPQEWVRAFQAEGRETPYPPWELFIGGCPASETWRAEALAALLGANLHQEQQVMLAQMMAGGMDRCDDSAALAWVIERLRQSATANDSGQLLSYLLVLRPNTAVRNHPGMRELMFDTSLGDDVRTEFAFAIQRTMGPEQREDFLISALRDGEVPREWAGLTSIGLLRERGDAFLRRIASEITADPASVWDELVMETIVLNLRHEERFPVSSSAVGALSSALARAAQDSRLPREAQERAAAFAQRAGRS